MTMQDTWKYGSLYVDAALTIDRLEDGSAFTEDQREALCAFEESGADFSFDPDYHGLHTGGFYGGDQLPLVLIGTFGGYPGESMDLANAAAAKEWASDRDDVMAYSSWFGGCEMVSLWYDLSSITASRESAQEAVDLAEGFREYPVLDEDLWSRYQSDEWDGMVGEMIVDTEREREVEISEDQRDQIRELAQEWFGYWEEGYFPEDKWNEIIDQVLTGEVQLHQDVELPLDFSECNCSNPYCQA